MGTRRLAVAAKGIASFVGKGAGVNQQTAAVSVQLHRVPGKVAVPAAPLAGVECEVGGVGIPRITQQCLPRVGKELRSRRQLARQRCCAEKIKSLLSHGIVVHAAAFALAVVQCIQAAVRPR